MKITEVRLRHLNMDLVAPFTTSFGTFVDKEFILVEVKNGEGFRAGLNLWRFQHLGITKKP